MSAQAVKNWELNTVVSRLSALQEANRTAADAQECNKITRRMNPVGSGGLPTGLNSVFTNELASNQSFDPSVLGVRTPPRGETPRADIFESSGTAAEQMAYEQ